DRERSQLDMFERYRLRHTSVNAPSPCTGRGDLAAADMKPVRDRGRVLQLNAPRRSPVSSLLALVVLAISTCASPTTQALASTAQPPPCAGTFQAITSPDRTPACGIASRRRIRAGSRARRMRSSVSPCRCGAGLDSADRLT